MSNMAQMIMEGASIGVGSANLTHHHYDHENGAGMIAMESAEALRSIFEDVFYIPNTCTIQAAMEGASCVEESSQAAIMEGALKGAFEKIKKFFIDLKEKVKEFLHNIKRYLLGVFQNDEKWVKQYEKELNAINKSDLKDYKIKMYTYTIEKSIDATALASKAEALTNKVNDTVAQAKSASKGRDDSDSMEEELRETAEKTYKGFLQEMCGKAVDEDEYDKELWSKMRNGADNENDKDDVDVASNMSSFISALKTSTKDAAAYDTCVSKTDKMYQNAIKLVDKAQKEFGNLGTDDKGHSIEHVGAVQGEGFTMGGTRTEYNTQYVTSSLRLYSSNLSKMQSAQNKVWNAAKSALVERNSAYKKALVGAFSYARKNKK